MVMNFLHAGILSALDQSKVKRFGDLKVRLLLTLTEDHVFQLEFMPLVIFCNQLCYKLLFYL